MKPLNVKLEVQKLKQTKKMLGVTIDNKLNLEDHISELCKKASMQLNAIIGVQRCMGKEQKEAVIDSFTFSNFNYCPLVWPFCLCKSSQKIEKLQLRCLRIIYNDYSSDYQTLLKLSQKPSMEIKRLRNLALEIFKTTSRFSAKLNARVRYLC